MESRLIRKKFLDFFASKEHTVVESAPMVIKGDPTLMFTNAGMNQFKDIFLGNTEPKSTRVANSQKCLRVSGKHNDLEEVGVDTYHHTMFEMLGNWSFGDYFKKEAIQWSWELLTNVYGLDKNRLYVTIFEGDEKDGTHLDSEALEFWKEWISEDRILPCDKKDNFWEMGDQGPCGPCSEIHIDLRPEEDRTKVDGKTLVNEDHPQVVEIWNLVFMQFNRMANGSLVPLKSKHIDTGMGFERLAMALQGKTSNYDTDVFAPLLSKIEEFGNVKYLPVGEVEGSDVWKVNVAMRVIADHVRAIAFSIADGQLPSNTGAGYVIRRILRRAVRYGYSVLNLKDPFMFELVDVLCGQMGEAFPELEKQKSLIQNVIKEEESSFFRTLEQGLKRIEAIIKGLEGKKEVSGDEVFELYDTFGFPVDLTALILAENGMTYDESGFEKCLDEQKQRSKKDAASDTSDWTEVNEGSGNVFIGYDETNADVSVVRYRTVTVKDKEIFQVVLNKTPFYPEGGGQVGDKGLLIQGEEKYPVFDTKKENNIIIHFMNKLPDDMEGTFKAEVNVGRRDLIANNHSATHLMHEVLREVLGTHVEQKGSLVNEKVLRFDFSHFGKMTDEEIQQVEMKVNQKIRENHLLAEHREISIDEAQNAGAMMLFGEKYGDKVRMIEFGSSKELCGGIHVPSTSVIGAFKIVSESSIASGIRRVEAITNEAADAFVSGQLDTLKDINDLLKSPKDLKKAVLDLIEKNTQQSKEIESLKKEKAGNMKQTLLDKVEHVNGINFIGEKVDLDSSSIKDLAFQLKGQVDNLFMILGSENGGKAVITIAVSDSLVEKGMHAGNMVRELAKEIGGGGGGQPFFATAGGKNAAGIPNALEKAKSYLN